VLAVPRARIPKYWEIRTQGSSDASSGLGCAKHARQQHTRALGLLGAASCERCCACHSHRRYFVHLTLRRTYVVVSMYWCTVGGHGGGAQPLSTPPTQEEYNFPICDTSSRRLGQPTPAPSATQEQLACSPPRVATRGLNTRTFGLFGLCEFDLGVGNLSFCGCSIDTLSGERKKEEPHTSAGAVAARLCAARRQ
jgi:hypothetical protein